MKYVAKVTGEDVLSAPCPESQYKDNRHEWENKAGEHMFTVPVHAEFHVVRCSKCKVHAVTLGPVESYDCAPTKNTSVLFTFYVLEAK